MSRFGSRRALYKSASAAALADPPSFRSIGTAAHSSGNVTPGLPAGKADNDVIFLAIESDNIDYLTGNPINPALPAPFAAPRGDYSPLGAFPSTGTGVSSSARITVGWARGSDVVSDPTVVDSGDHNHAVVAAFKDVKLGADPFGTDSHAGSVTASTTIVLPGITTPSDNCRVIWFIVDPVDSTGAWISSPTCAALTDIQEHYDARFSDGSGGGLGIISGLKVTAGATGDLTFTAPAGSQAYRYIVLCLERQT